MKTAESKNHLSENFYRVPNAVSTTMTRKELKETLLSTDGWIFACGEAWDITNKHIGAGVYRVSLVRKNL